jgi:hypothetical protein
MNETWNSVVTMFSGANSQTMYHVGIGPFLFLLAIALVSSFVVAALYLFFYAETSSGSQIHRSFPLFGLAVTALFVAMQFSLPLSLGLLGALSIVRFRTPVKEPEEIGFVMVIVGVGIACATFKLTFLAIFLAATAGALLLQKIGAHRIAAGHRSGVVVVTIPTDQYDARMEAISGVLRKHFLPGRLASVSKGRGRVVVSYHFDGSTEPDLRAIGQDLEGHATDSNVDIVFRRNEAS